jgi:biopolymer transport protein ExbD
MPIDTKRFKDKLERKNPNINLVPLLDVIFTIMIFLLVMLSQTPADMHHSQDQISAKPEANSGTSEYYLIPLGNLHKVTVNGVDKSQYIRNGAVAVHTRVIDEGQINIDSSTGTITIRSPADIADKAVRAPSTS